MAKKNQWKKLDLDAIAEAERFGALAVSRNYKNNLKKWQRQYRIKCQYAMKMLKLDKRQAAAIIGIPVKRLKIGNSASSLEKRYFLQWKILVKLISDFFNGDETKTKLWLTLPNPNLGNVSPREMIILGRYERLMKFVRNALSENKPPSD